MRLPAAPPAIDGDAELTLPSKDGVSDSWRCEEVTRCKLNEDAVLDRRRGKMGAEVCVVALSGSSSSSSRIGSSFKSCSRISSSSSPGDELGLVCWLGPEESFDKLPDPFGGGGSG